MHMETQSESIAPLIADLHSPDEFVRAQASFALGMLGEPAVLPLVELLKHAQRSVRMRAAWALGVIGQPAVPALLALAEDPNPRYRIEAIRILGVIGEGRTLGSLINALTDSDARIAQRAALALGRIGDPRAFHALQTALRHPSPDVRYAACGALAMLHIGEVLPALRQLIGEERALTSWGASVADAARRAVAEIEAAQQSSYDEFAQIESMLRRHPAERRSVAPDGEI
jgi:HEAT repeat protein